MILRSRALPWLALLLLCVKVSNGSVDAEEETETTVPPPTDLEASTTSSTISKEEESSVSPIDESWPTHSLERFLQSATNHAQRVAYTAFMKGCYDNHGLVWCNRREQDRLARNVRQPAKVHHNLTTTGYTKLPTPDATRDLLLQHLNHHQHNLDTEDWGTTTTVLNHWTAPTDMQDLTLFLPLADRQIVQSEIQQAMQTWIGRQVQCNAMYGIRVYRQGTIVAPHVDRLPLVLSAVINVEQEQDGEDWPLELVGHDGLAVNVTLQPGEMVLYEGHSVIHGRPYELQKWYYANVYLHFEPVGYSYELKQAWQQEAQAETGNQKSLSERQHDWARDAFHKALDRQQQQRQGMMTKQPRSKMAAAAKMPSYITPESDQELRWKQHFIFHREPKMARRSQMTVGATAAHTVAANGDLEALKREIEKNPAVADQADVNGWKPLHEAARGGQTKVLEYLIAQGVDINERTHDGKGASALWWAERNFSPNHPAVKLLKKHGGVSLAPRHD